ncbi:unnamed protein product [Nesidiocoris tenuis]|uniref:Uncharacterized protein n=1 Tax=Nesidiocoris tenuis TaxID=355587 RepID=A0A6H5GCS1_9HEMI|nr:unnamed protein product [Nesidiocoris tenuis]
MGLLDWADDWDGVSTHVWGRVNILDRVDDLLVLGVNVFLIRAQNCTNLDSAPEDVGGVSNSAANGTRRVSSRRCAAEVRARTGSEAFDSEAAVYKLSLRAAFYFRTRQDAPVQHAAMMIELRRGGGANQLIRKFDVFGSPPNEFVMRRYGRRRFAREFVKA